MKKIPEPLNADSKRSGWLQFFRSWIIKLLSFPFMPRPATLQIVNKQRQYTQNICKSQIEEDWNLQSEVINNQQEHPWNGKEFLKLAYPMFNQNGNRPFNSIRKPKTFKQNLHDNTKIKALRKASFNIPESILQDSSN